MSFQSFELKKKGINVNLYSQKILLKLLNYWKPFLILINALFFMIHPKWPVWRISQIRIHWDFIGKLSKFDKVNSLNFCQKKKNSFFLVLKNLKGKIFRMSMIWKGYQQNLAAKFFKKFTEISWHWFIIFDQKIFIGFKQKNNKIFFFENLFLSKEATVAGFDFNFLEDPFFLWGHRNQVKGKIQN